MAVINKNYEYFQMLKIYINLTFMPKYDKLIQGCNKFVTIRLKNETFNKEL